MPDTHLLTGTVQPNDAKISDTDLDILIKYLLPPDFLSDDELPTEDCPEPDRIEAVVSGHETFTDVEKAHVEIGCKNCALMIEISQDDMLAKQVFHQPS